MLNPGPGPPPPLKWDKVPLSLNVEIIAGPQAV